MSGKRNLSADGCTINTLLLCIRRDVTGLVRRSQQVELLQLDRYGTGINACSSSSGALHVHQTCNRLGNVQTVPLFVKYCNSHKWFALIYAAGFISPPKTLFSINNQWILTTNHALTPTLNSHIQCTNTDHRHGMCKPRNVEVRKSTTRGTVTIPKDYIQCKLQLKRGFRWTLRVQFSQNYSFHHLELLEMLPPRHPDR